MKLWLITAFNGDDLGYDTARGFVVRASTEASARHLAASEGGDEGDDVWLNPHKSLCVELTAEGERGVILRDYAAG